jgi:uncharacterized repeat protein (TIGR01451 family)
MGLGNLLTAVMAAPLAPGVEIKNTAVGSFLDEEAPATTVPTIVESNEVTVTVAEVAGINVISAGVAEAETTVVNAGTYQGDGTINAGDVIYYDYLITNVGNDPTQFFIPESPSNVSNGTFNISNPIQVIAYNLTGTSVVLPTPVNVPAGGSRTGPTTATGTTGGLLAKNGIIPPGGSVTIRVPIKINTTATANQVVSVIMGNTAPNDNSAATQNQVYLNNNNQDIYTQDNLDGTTNAVNVVIETAGEPINGDSTLNGNTTNNHRQEASATAQATVVLPLVQGFKSVRLTTDADHSATITATASGATSPIEILTWTISYINNSATTSIPNFQIADRLPTNVPITATGAQTITINTAQGSTPPAKNTSYTGASTTPGASVNNLLASPITLLPGGVITVSVPVKVNNGTLGIISNQSIATGTGLMATGVKTDNVDRTTTNLPTGIIVPVDSVIQTQNNSIDPTTVTVVNTREYVVSPDRDKIIINEVFYTQTGGNTIAGNDEFIELYNASSASVDLSGWKLIDGNLIDTTTGTTGINANDDTGSITGNSSPFVFGVPLGTGVQTQGNSILQPGEYAVIWIGRKNTNTQITGTPPAFQVWLDNSPKLNNDGDDVWLYDSQTRIVDYMAYGVNNTNNKAINIRPPAALNLWDSSFESKFVVGGTTPTVINGQSISLTPNGQNPGHTSGCWEPTTSGAAASPATRCPGALPTRDIEISPIPRTTSVGVNNNGAMTTSPNVLLVKRITAINGLPNKTTGESITGYEHFNTYDDNVITIPTQPTSTDPQKDTDKWPNNASGFLLGTTNGGSVKPNDSIDYTIYFLSAGDSTANNVLLCDRVPANVTFSPNTFTNTSTNPSGVARGIAVQFGSNPPSYYTNSADSDLARYFPPGIEPNTVYPTINCGRDPLYPNDPTKFLPNDNGAVVVNLGNQPAGDYGFVRFRGLVK